MVGGEESLELASVRAITHLIEPIPTGLMARGNAGMTMATSRS